MLCDLWYGEIKEFKLIGWIQLYGEWDDLILFSLYFLFSKVPGFDLRNIHLMLQQNTMILPPL